MKFSKNIEAEMARRLHTVVDKMYLEVGMSGRANRSEKPEKAYVIQIYHDQVVGYLGANDQCVTLNSPQLSVWAHYDIAADEAKWSIATTRLRPFTYLRVVYIDTCYLHDGVTIC